MKSLLCFVLVCIYALSLGGPKVVPRPGMMKLTFGYTIDPDGTKRSLAGLELPIYAEKIKASRLQVKHPRHVKTLSERVFGNRKESLDQLFASMAPVPAAKMFDTTVFNDDSGSYGIIDPETFVDPSSLDDIVMAGGSGNPWNLLTFGVDISDTHAFLARWICYTTYTTGLGHDVMAFSGTWSANADFGGVINPATIPGYAGPGTYKLTVQVAPAGVVPPQNNIYLAQQFRDTSDLINGNGPFDVTLRNVYCSDAPPSIGQSDIYFWFDWDPLNGIYAEDEIDYFGEGTYGNLLHTITAGGGYNSLVPSSYSIPVGKYVSGDVTDLWFSDDSYVVVKPGLTLSSAIAPVQLQVNGLSPTANVTSLSFTAEVGSSSAGGIQRISLFNYTTNSYDLINTRTMTATDQETQVVITNNPRRYVNQSDRKVKSLIAIFPPATAARGWAANFDLAGWLVTHP